MARPRATWTAWRGCGWSACTTTSNVCDVFPGTREALEALRARGVRLGVVTSKNSAESTRRISCPSLWTTYFDTIVTADDTALHKPHAEPLLKFLERARGEARKRRST